MKSKVLVVDDSPSAREVLKAIINSDPNLEVMAVAENADKAMLIIEKNAPDVITLDVHMPGMDGLTFLKRLMKTKPIPVVIVSSLTREGSDITMHCLAAGAIDFVFKSRMDLNKCEASLSSILLQKVHMALKSNVTFVDKYKSEDLQSDKDTVPVSPVNIIGIGASTGGVEALKFLANNLPLSAPPIIVTQHMPPSFINAFQALLQKSSAISICVAEQGMALNRGHLYIAPSDVHLGISSKYNTYYSVELNDAPLIGGHRPAVDFMFASMAEVAGRNAMCIIMSGMGNDGAKGIKQAYDAGGYTIAQDEASSVIWGMPQEAIKAGGVKDVRSLGQIVSCIRTVAAQQDSEAKSS